MAIDRRQFGFGLIAGIATVPAIGRADSAASAASVTTARDRLTGRFLAVALDADLEVVWETPLPGRGHGPVVRPGHAHVVIAARRPQTFAIVINAATGETVRRLASPAGRHFLGHGAFGPDARTLFMTENVYETGAGILGIYDATDGYRRLGEIDAGGIGPHEVISMPDGRALCVANGGIRTHPGHGRRKLNIDTMRPSLQMIDVATGRFGRSYAFDTPRAQKLSLRHMAAMPDGRVIVGCQDEGAVGDALPLVYIADPKAEGLTPMSMPQEMVRRLSGYVGSVAVSIDGRRMVASAPRGNAVAEWDGRSGAFIGLADGRDVCGLAATPDSVLRTSGMGDVRLGDLGKSYPFRQWDNHAVAI